jgi:hypothetical protein
MRGRFTAVMAALGTAAALLAPAAPAHASVTGGTAFTCAVTLPVFPTSRGTGGACKGTATGALTVVDTKGQPHTLAGTGPMNAAFDYGTTCVASEPETTTMDGTLTMTLPQADGGQAVVTAQFSAQLIGIVWVVFTRYMTVYDLGGGWYAVEVGDDIGIGILLFSVIPDCSSPKPVTGTLVANDAAAA